MKHLKKVESPCMAAQIAATAFEGKRDSHGNRLIHHALRVGFMGKTDEEKAVGFLHDILRDTETTAKDLIEIGFNGNIVKAVLILTQDEWFSYSDYLDKLCESKNKLVLQVKLNDLEDNIAFGSRQGLTTLVNRHIRARDKIRLALFGTELGEDK